MASFTDRIKIVIDVVTDGAKSSFASFKKDIADADGITGKFKAGLGGIGNLIKSNGLAIAAGATAVVVGLSKMAKGAAETDAAFASLNQIAGETIANDVAGWAKDGAEQFGMSERDIFKYSTQLANIGQSVGMSEEQMRTFIQTHLTMAADLAAFADTSPDKVMEDMRSAYAGSTETLQKYGIFAQDANLKTAIFNKTGQKITGTLTAQQKVMGINILLAEKGAAIAGQWARESDSLSGQQARLKAEWTNISDTLGRAFLPAMIESNEALLKMAPLAEEAATNIAAVVSVLSKLKVPELLGHLGDINRGLLGLATPTVGFFKNLIKGSDDADQAISVLPDTIDKLRRQQEDYTDFLEGRYADAHADIADAYAKSREQANRYADDLQHRGVTAQRDAAQALKETEAAARREADQIETLDRRWKALNDTLSDRSAFLDVQQGFEDLVKAQKDLDQARADGSISEGEYARKSEQLMIQQKQSVLDYVQKLGNVPPQKATEILTLVDQGQFMAAEAMLDQLTRDRAIKLRVDTGQVQAALKLLPGQKYAAGTPSAAPGLALVGEEGPELVEMAGGETVHTADQTRRLLTAPAASHVTTVHQYFPAGVRPDDVVRAQRRYERRNGQT